MENTQAPVISFMMRELPRRLSFELHNLSRRIYQLSVEQQRELAKWIQRQVEEMCSDPNGGRCPYIHDEEHWMAFTPMELIKIYADLHALFRFEAEGTPENCEEDDIYEQINEARLWAFQFIEHHLDSRFPSKRCNEEQDHGEPSTVRIDILMTVSDVVQKLKSATN